MTKLRCLIAVLRGAHTLAVHYVLSRVLRSVRLALNQLAKPGCLLMSCHQPN